jgi:heptosyltransferase-2/heptosyltransferase-3
MNRLLEIVLRVNNMIASNPSSRGCGGDTIASNVNKSLTTSRDVVRRRFLGILKPKEIARSARIPPARIAVVRPDHIGDVVLAAPAIERLVDAFPGAKIDLFVGPWSADVARGCRGVDVQVLRFPGFQRENRPRIWEPYVQVRREAESLRSRRYDAALILRFDHFWGAMLAAWSGIPIRIGFDQPDTRLFLTDQITHRPGLHESDQNLRLVDFAIQRLCGAAVSHPAGAPSLQFDEAPPLDLPTRKFAVFHPGAGAPVKRWLPEAFAAVGRWLSEEKGMSVIVTAGPGEKDLAEAVQLEVGLDSKVVSGLSISQLARLLSGAQLALGPDSGVLHIASAVGTPTVRLYGPVDHRAFGPYQDAKSELVVADLPCVPCNRLDYGVAEVHLHPCVQSIEVARVIAAAGRLLSGSSK